MPNRKYTKEDCAKLKKVYMNKIAPEYGIKNAAKIKKDDLCNQIVNALSKHKTPSVDKKIPTSPKSPKRKQFTKEDFNVLDEKVISLVANLPTLQISLDGSSVSNQIQKVRAIPYYTWCNRGSNAMQIWLPTSFKDIKVNY